MNIQGRYIAPKLKNVFLFQLYQEILKDHTYNSSLVSKYTSWGVGGKLFSVGSPYLWHLGNKIMGRIPLPFKTQHFWPLKTEVGGKTWVTAQQWDGPLYLESSSTSLIHLANVHIWKHVGPGAESWRSQSLPMTQRSEGAELLTCEAKKKKKTVWPETESKKNLKKNHILMNPKK